MAEYPRIRGGKLTVLNPVPAIRRVWLRASEALSTNTRVSPILLFWIPLLQELTLYPQGDCYQPYLKRLETG